MNLILAAALLLLFLFFSAAVYGFISRAPKKNALRVKNTEDLVNLIIKNTGWLAAVNSLPAAAFMKGYLRRLGNKLHSSENTANLEPAAFMALKEVLGAACAIAVTLLYGGLNVFMLALFFILGFFYPDLWLEEQIKRREKKVLRELPYAVDLLALCVEAGMDFTAAMARISSGREGCLDREFTRFVNELKLGKTRRSALEDMAERVRVEEFGNFTATLITADEMGTSIGGTLKILSEEIRSKLSARLEKKAMEAPVKILLPLVAFIFPAIFIIIFGPIMITGVF